MANRYFSKTIESVSFSHLPTFLLVIGYPVFWLELFIFNARQGITTPLASLIFVAVAVVVVIKRCPAWAKVWRDALKEFQTLDFFSRILISAGIFFTAIILLISFYASLLPPHLKQEYDALNYHLTIPRQHLIVGNFAHIPWSHADLFLLPIDFALSPYWFATTLPNKFPQFIFLLGLIGVGFNLLNIFRKDSFLNKTLFLFAIVGSHGIGIQMGTAMLDLVAVYLFLAACDSFLRGQLLLSAIEFAFYFWSKSFVPIQFTIIAVAVVAIIFVLKCFKFSNIRWDIEEGGVVKKDLLKHSLKLWSVYFFTISLAVAGPFLMKSMYYAGTPFYPLFPGSWKINSAMDYSSEHWRSIVDSAHFHINSIKDGYGHGRSWGAFIKHFWLVAVPEKDVNNTFDYPLGLAYLLFLGPFVVHFMKSLQKKELPIISFFIIMYWLLWFFGSQQSRFLFIPLILMYLTVVAQMERPSIVFLTALILALALNVLSVYRAHKRDFVGFNVTAVLRDQDKKILEMNKKYIQEHRSDTVPMDFNDVPYAQFPVTVTQKKYPYVLSL